MEPQSRASSRPLSGRGAPSARTTAAATTVGATTAGGERARFEPRELASVLRCYDLGRVTQIREFPRGSRRSPKVRITTSEGDYLLKRRAPGRDEPDRVAFTHELQQRLARDGFPLAELIPGRDRLTGRVGSTMLHHHSHVYELFRFVVGSGYDQTVEQTRRAGAALGQMHRLLGEVAPSGRLPGGSYHAGAGIDSRFAEVGPAVARVEPGVDRPGLAGHCNALQRAYHGAASRVDALGYRAWPAEVVHGDWHPGNLIYRDGRIAAVLDFDSARFEPRMSDVANAVLQFSMTIGRADDPTSWPEALDESRIAALLRGYHEQAPRPLEGPELEALPWLLIEALIVESVVPIAVTGSFARIRGSAFLAMARRKAQWIAERASRLSRLGASGRQSAGA